MGADGRQTRPTRPDGVTGSAFPGPFPVGSYAALLRDELRKRARVQLFGEVFNVSLGRARVYFELRDGVGAVPCAMWRDEFDRLRLPDGVLVDGAQVVVAGGPDYYPGSRTSSPSFSFDVTGLRVAGDGDLLAQVDALRKRLAAEGLLEPQKLLPRPRLPRCIGVVTGEGGKARGDVLAGLERRGWAGRVVWAFAPCRTGTRRRRSRARSGPRGPRGGRGDRRRPRRRLARRPVRLLRRDAVPDGGDAPRAGDRVGRPPHRSHADRRRRRRRVLDTNPRRGDGGPAATAARRARDARARRARGLPRRARRAVLGRARATLRASSRARRASTSPASAASAPDAPRAAGARRPPRARARRTRRRARSSSAARGRGRAGRRRAPGDAPRWPRARRPRPRAPWSAATPSSTTARAT